MGRTIEEIKAGMTTDFMRNSDVARAYGFEPGAAFSAHFSKVSIESLLFYIVACCTWVLESIFERHKIDVEVQIEAILPHRPKWYRDKVLAFMEGYTLITDTDRYDTTGLTDNQIEAARTVKFAAASENADASILTIKVAGEGNDGRAPLSPETEEQLSAYISEIKDAGVRVNLINQEADAFNCSMEVYYDAMLLPDSVKTACRAAVQGYIENLPFNGEYSNMALVDALQIVDGVKIVELGTAEVMVSGEGTPRQINARYTPASGYFKAGNIIINMTPYK